MSDSRPNVAKQIMQQAHREQMRGDLENAIRLYRASLDILPMAQAHVGLARVFGMQHRYQDAISACLEAVALDGALGAPYHDIGQYLIAMDKWEEAINWLERAIAAPKHDGRAATYMILGNVHLHLNKIRAAASAYRRAWHTDPTQIQALDAYQAVLSKLN